MNNFYFKTLIGIFISLILFTAYKNIFFELFSQKTKCFSCEKESNKNHAEKCYSCEDQENNQLLNLFFQRL